MKKTVLILNLIAGSMVLIFSVLALFTPFRYTGSTEQDVTDARYGWYYVDQAGNVTDKEADLHELEFDDDKNVTVARTIVAGGLAGDVHPRLAAELQKVLHLHDKEVGAGRHAGADHAPAPALIVRDMHIAGGEVAVALARGLKPAHELI